MQSRHHARRVSEIRSAQPHARVLHCSPVQKTRTRSVGWSVRAALDGIRRGAQARWPLRRVASAARFRGTKAAAAWFAAAFYWVRARRAGTFCSRRPFGWLPAPLPDSTRRRVLPSRPFWAPRSILRVRVGLRLFLSLHLPAYPLASEPFFTVFGERHHPFFYRRGEYVLFAEYYQTTSR